MMPPPTTVNDAANESTTETPNRYSDSVRQLMAKIDMLQRKKVQLVRDEK
jgi:hypothetical protein